MVFVCEQPVVCFSCAQTHTGKLSVPDSHQPKLFLYWLAWPGSSGDIVSSSWQAGDRVAPNRVVCASWLVMWNRGGSCRPEKGRLCERPASSLQLLDTRESARAGPSYRGSGLLAGKTHNRAVLLFQAELWLPVPSRAACRLGAYLLQA
jgi:hypothetical protein